MSDVSNVPDADLLAAAGAPQAAPQGQPVVMPYDDRLGIVRGPDGSIQAITKGFESPQAGADPKNIQSFLGAFPEDPANHVGTPAPDLSRAADADLLAATQPSRPLQPNQALGFEQGLERPFRNMATWAGDALNQVPGFGGQSLEGNIDQFQQKLGLGSDQQFRDRPAVQDAAAAAQGQRPGAIGDFAGGVLGTLPLAIATKNPFALGAASGALTSDQPENPAAVATSAGMGAVLGKAGDVGVNALAHAIGPSLSPAVQALQQAGVKLSPGQLLGGGAQRIEDSLTHLPFLGDMIKGAQNKSLQSFNTAAINRSLAPIGQSLPDNLPFGHAAIDHAATQLSGAYDSLLPSLHVQLDQPFHQGLADAVARTSTLPPTQQTQFSQILADAVGRAGQDGSMTGEAFQAADSKLGALGRRYGRSPDPDQQGLASAIQSLQGNFRDTAERQNPWSAPALQGAREGYANLVRVEGAGSSAAAKNGLFTAAQLANAVKSADSSGRHAAIAHGGALMQDLSDAGQQVLPSTVADSGTALRGLMETGILGLGAHEAGMLNPTTMAGVGALAVPYTKPGLAASRYILGGPRPAPAHLLADAIRRLAPASGLAGVGAPAAAQALQQPPQGSPGP